MVEIDYSELKRDINNDKENNIYSVIDINNTLIKNDNININDDIDYICVEEKKTPRRLILPYIPTNSDASSIDIPFRGKILVTIILISLWFGCFLSTMCTSNWVFAPLKLNWMVGPSASNLILSGGMTYDKVFKYKEYWRLVTCEFCHAGFIHLIMNVLSIYFIGELLEPDWGSLKFLYVFITSAVTASVFTINWADKNTVCVGSSGGVFGVMTSILVFIIEYWNYIPNNKKMFAYVFIFIGISLCLSFIPTVDWRAHLGGAIGGLLSSLSIVRDIPFISGHKINSDKLEEEKKYNIRKMKHMKLHGKRVFKIDNENLNMNCSKIKESNDNLDISNNNIIYLYDIEHLEEPAIIKNMNPSATRFSFIKLENLITLHKSNNITNDYNRFNTDNSIIWTVRVFNFILLLAINFIIMYFIVKDYSLVANNNNMRKLARITIDMQTGYTDIGI